MNKKQYLSTTFVWWGLGLLAVGLLAPMFITVHDIGIIKDMERSIATGNISFLIMAVVKLAVVNTVRGFPIYTGLFLISEGLALFQHRRAVVFHLVSFLLVPVIYEMIYYLHGIMYDFGVPAVTMLFMIIIANRLRNLARRTPHKIIVFVLILFGVQCLDFVPLLSSFGFGRGETSMDIKRIAEIHHAVNVLNIVGISLFVLLVGNAFILARFLQLYTKEIFAVERELELESLNHQLRLQTLENRSLREMQALVHDLKTPLTAIQGLAGVMSMSGEQNTREYSNYISETVDKMNIMISELLHDDKRHVISVKELLEYSTAHIPKLNEIANFHLAAGSAPLFVKVNKIKMARAIINLLENAIAAVKVQTGVIRVETERQNDKVMIIITDNGKGIEEQIYQQVWEVGFSTKNSSGIGLAFVRDVVKKNGGSITIASNFKQGTKITISLPEVGQNDGTESDEKNKDIGY